MKKVLFVALCCSIIVLSSGCGAKAPQVSAQDKADIVLETTEVDGEEYYVLTSEEDIEAIGNQYPLSGNYILGNNISLSNEWIPIGSPDNPFTGVFDGNGYTIDNLTVSKKTDDMGFFGAARDAVIKDIILENANIDVTSFFPIVYSAENTEITGCSINGDKQEKASSGGSSSAGYSFDEEEALIKRIIDADYQDMSIADFQAFTLEVFTDTDTLGSVLGDLENYFDNGSNENYLVQYSLPATYSELSKDGNAGTFKNHVEKERTAGREILDTIEFSCDIEYTITYEISDEKLTVSDRDNFLENVQNQLEEYIDGADEDFLTSSRAEDAVEEKLQSIVKECSIEGMSANGSITDISVLD